MSGRNVKGLLADANLVGHFDYVIRLLQKHGLVGIFQELALSFETIGALELPSDIDDRSLWSFCQREGWVMFTENRNADGIDSLQATLIDSWRPGHLPVVTLANKTEFQHSADYRERVAAEIAELLFGVAIGEYRDEARIYVPRLPGEP